MNKVKRAKGTGENSIQHSKQRRGKMKKVSLLSFLVLSLAFIPVRDVKAQNIAREFQANVNENNYYLDAFPSKQAISATTAPEIAQAAQKITPKKKVVEKPVKCISFDYRKAAVKKIAGHWKIVVGRNVLKDFGKSEKEARQTLRIIKHYRMNKRCLLGHPKPSMEYYLVSGKAPTGYYKGEDSLGFNPAKVAVKKIGGRWKIVEGTHSILDFGAKADEAKMGFKIIKQYRFNRLCFIGLPGPSMTYFTVTKKVAGKPAKEEVSKLPTAEVAEKTTPRIESVGKPPVKPLEPKQPRVPSIIQVLSPNGRETWETGIRYTIRWTSRGIRGNVKIMLKRPDRSYKIAESVPNTGSYSYTVPKNIPQGSNYTVHVMTLDGKVKDWSDKYFSITKREIIVLAPNGGEKLEQGREYTVRWRTSGRIEKVNIDVLGMEERATCYYTVGKNVPNTGSYRWRVSPMSSRSPSPRPGVRCPVLQKGKYKLHISATKGRVGDESDGRFEIIPPEVELTCGFLKYGKVTKKKFYVFYGEREEYIRFEVFVENKGRGTKILSRVPFMWTMLKQPRNIVILQHEAGFGDVYPNRRYTTTFKYNIKKIKAYPGYVGKERKLKKGDYSFVFEVDPRNELREPEWTRKNNKCEVNFKIK